jgi:hypothetical protein
MELEEKEAQQRSGNSGPMDETYLHSSRPQ